MFLPSMLGLSYSLSNSYRWVKQAFIYSFSSELSRSISTLWAFRVQRKIAAARRRCRSCLSSEHSYAKWVRWDGKVTAGSDSVYQDVLFSLVLFPQILVSYTFLDSYGIHWTWTRYFFINSDFWYFAQSISLFTLRFCRYLVNTQIWSHFVPSSQVLKQWNRQSTKKNEWDKRRIDIGVSRCFCTVSPLQRIHRDLCCPPSDNSCTNTQDSGLSSWHNLCAPWSVIWLSWASSKLGCWPHL